MDTKSQSRIFSSILFVAALICIGLAFLTSFENKIDIEGTEVSYFHDSPEIRKMVLRYSKNLQRYFIYYKNFDISTAQNKLNEIDKYMATGAITPERKNYDVIVRPFAENENLGNEYKDEKTKIENKNPEDLYNFTIENITVDELLKYQSELSDAISNYNSVRDYLNNNDDFHFIIFNTRLGHIVATNSDSFYNEECYDSITLTDSLFNTDFNGENLINSFRNNDLSCEILIPLTTSANVKSHMAILHRQLSNNEIFSSYIVSVVLAGVAILLILLIFLYDINFLKFIDNEFFRIFRKIPVVISLPVMIMIAQTCYLIYNMKKSLITGMIINGYTFRLFIAVFLSIFTVIFTVLFIKYIYTLIRRKTRLSETPDVAFIVRGVNECRIALNAGKMFFSVVMGTMLFLLICFACVLFILTVKSAMFMPYIIGLWLLIFVLVILYNICSSEVRLRYYIQEMANGHMEAVPEQKGFFTNSINQLNGISKNFRQNMEETIKSERMKTDLITNVSHDLKTPLTSIINYVELLSSLDNNSDAAKEYIEVIRNKSRRLKTLIDDLFEASKLSSGQMKLKCVNSDIVSLLEQTLGELSYKIEDSGIEFVVSNTDKSIIVNMDGERMWRVFDNLVNNILKYSPKNSRAYIDISEDETNVIITFKNVANYHMEFNADELFDRFKRGDTARTTEGSGLGLSIAKSIVELHGGTMYITTDGDLFKIAVSLVKADIDK